VYDGADAMSISRDDGAVWHILGVEIMTTFLPEENRHNSVVLHDVA